MKHQPPLLYYCTSYFQVKNSLVSPSFLFLPQNPFQKFALSQMEMITPGIAEDYYPHFILDPKNPLLHYIKIL